MVREILKHTYITLSELWGPVRVVVREKFIAFMFVLEKSPKSVSVYLQKPEREEQI